MHVENTQFHAFSFFAQKRVHGMDVCGVYTKRQGRGIDFMPDQCRELDHKHMLVAGSSTRAGQQFSG